VRGDWSGQISEGTKKMPILDDIMDHDLFGPAIRQGMELGRQEGYQLGEQAILLRQIEKRFGPVPGWALSKLETLSAADLERLALRLLDAQGLEELLR
jgi:hypothetical protein